MQAMNTDLRYPVGRFDMKAPLPESGRTPLIKSLASVPERMRNALASLSEAQLNTPYREGGWTVRQVVHHVPESHMNAYVRMKWGLTEDNPTIKTYDEALWAELIDARTAPVELSLALLTALHARWDVLLNKMTESEYQRTIRHPEWGQISLSKLLQLYEWHGRHHEAHVRALRERMSW
jgi:uncharacterized damage-inducible protein DinB